MRTASNKTPCPAPNPFAASAALEEVWSSLDSAPITPPQYFNTSWAFSRVFFHFSRSPFFIVAVLGTPFTVSTASNTALISRPSSLNSAASSVFLTACAPNSATSNASKTI